MEDLSCWCARWSSNRLCRVLYEDWGIFAEFRVGILVGDWNVIGELVVYWQWIGRGSVQYVGLVEY